MDKKEKTLESSTIYNGKVVRLRKDIVLTPNGNESIREIVDHNGGVATLAFLEDKIIMIKQYRYAYDEELFEIPAGKLEKGENHLEAGKRELLEETGYVANSTTYLGCIYPTCGYSNEKIHIYLAKDLIKKERHLDDDEVIDLYFFTLDEINNMILKGEIKDAKTICAIQYLNLINP